MEIENLIDGGTVNEKQRRLFDLIEQLQALGQSGLYYGHDDYDKDRYQRVRELAAEMLAIVTEEPFTEVAKVFLADSGYQTPKTDTRAVIFNDENKVLLVHETNGKWALPGGWVDVGESVKSNTVKEAREEAGATVEPRRLLAVIDKKGRGQVRGPFSVFTFFVECDFLGGVFEENIETTERGWFGRDELPELASAKNNAEQLAMCFTAHADPDWKPVFD